MVTPFSIPHYGARRLPFTGGLRGWVFCLSVATLCFTSGPAVSCAFDMVKPEQTTIDWIVGSETLVLARPSDENPFVFNVTQILAGDDEGPPIDQLVDSASRRTLAAHPTDAVLFAHSIDNGWRRVAYVDEGFHGILRTALDHRHAWQDSMPQSRLKFITALQDSSVPAHKYVVIGELDKVPYSVLRTLDIRVSDKDLLRDLWSRTGYPYQATRALLLGLSGTHAARAEIHDYINRVTDWDWANNLGAFAAAYIELEGAAGVEHLATSMLLDANQPIDKIEQIVMAMSVHHGIGDQRLKTSIQDSIDTLITQRPSAGVVVARQFSLRSDWSQFTVLEPLVTKRSVGLSDLLTISVYVARARESSAIAAGNVYE